jgi:hypothetical protein
MTSRHETYDIGTVPFESAGDTETRGPASWPNRLRARVFASRYDQQIEDGLSPLPGSPLDLHGARLVSARERNDLACTLRQAVRDADSPVGPFHSRVRVASAAVRHSAEVIEAVHDRLADPFPVRARGMARLRILLSDGSGPLYRSGRGTLTAALRGVLAAL